MKTISFKVSDAEAGLIRTLAECHDCRLATLDEGIQNAFLIPVRQG